MKEEYVALLSKALCLQRQIVGVRFLAYPGEEEKSKGDKVWPAKSFCAMVHQATKGKWQKASGQSFSCPGGANALGIIEEPSYMASGRLYQHCGLYEDFATAREVIQKMQHFSHHNHGVEVGPLEKMEKADIVIILGSAKQMMRIMQGYAYKMGPAHHLSTIGNQAMCSDLVAKPFHNNDINLSLMCVGARACAHCDDGEMGCGMPLHLFEQVVEGVLKTLNVTETNKAKKEILNGLKEPEELGFPIIMDYNYGKNSQAYRKYCEEMQSEEN